MIVDIGNKIVSSEVDISEHSLQTIVTKNFGLLFPELKFLDSEFVLRGDVRQFGMSGRIDILAFDERNSRLVIFELKTTHSRNILVQALDYSDFIEMKGEVILHRLNNLTRAEIAMLIETNSQPEIILIAKEFTHPTLRRAENIEQPIRLFEYKYFENKFFQLDQLFDKPILRRQLGQNGSDDISNEEVVSIVKELIKLRLVSSDYCKVEDGCMTFNATHVYESYVDFTLGQKGVPISKRIFFKLLKESDSFIEIKRAVKFGKNNTSAIRMRM